MYVTRADIYTDISFMKRDIFVRKVMLPLKI